MKKQWVLFLSLVALTSWMGCNHSPEGTIQDAHTALNKGDVPAFKGLLTGEAKEQFQELCQIDELRKKVEGRKLTLSRPVVVGQPERDYQGRDRVRVYSVDVVDDELLAYILRLEVRCEVSHHYHHYNGLRRWDTDYWNSENCHDQEQLYCLISRVSYN